MFIRRQSKIYGRNSNRALTKYQSEINDDAYGLALESPVLLESRQQLLQEARKKVDEGGYSYKKGKSRSKSSTPTYNETPKHSVTTESIRQTRIVQMQEDIKGISERLQYKINRRDQASAVHNCKLCDQLMEEITHLKHRKRKYESELKM